MIGFDAPISTREFTSNTINHPQIINQLTRNYKTTPHERKKKQEIRYLFTHSSTLLKRLALYSFQFTVLCFISLLYEIERPFNNDSSPFTKQNRNSNHLHRDKLLPSDSLIIFTKKKLYWNKKLIKSNPKVIESKHAKTKIRFVHLSKLCNKTMSGQ